jgi:hypothetical protein
VDWDYGGDIFNSQVQLVRGWRDEEIDLQARHEYQESGPHRIAVRCVDQYGAETFTTEEINILA